MAAINYASEMYGNGKSYHFFLSGSPFTYVQFKMEL